jgi:hypothetical protein
MHCKFGSISVFQERYRESVFVKLINGCGHTRDIGSWDVPYMAVQGIPVVCNNQRDSESDGKYLYFALDSSCD